MKKITASFSKLKISNSKHDEFEIQSRPSFVQSFSTNGTSNGNAEQEIQYQLTSPKIEATSLIFNDSLPGHDTILSHVKKVQEEYKFETFEEFGLEQ